MGWNRSDYLTKNMNIQNDHEAYILAKTYNLCPPQEPVPNGDIDLNHGKYEPDNREGEAERWMILAQTLDATNILIAYEPAELPP